MVCVIIFRRLLFDNLRVLVSISSIFLLDCDMTSGPSCDVHEGSEIRAPWAEFEEPILSPSNANPTTQPGEIGEEVVAEIEVSGQTQSLSEEEFSVSSILARSTTGGAVL